MSSKHILLVEDELDISDLIKLQLTGLGHEVTVIPNGTQAIEFIQTPPI